MIAACGFETESFSGVNSFTHAFIEELVGKSTEGVAVFSTMDLHMGVLMRLLDRRANSKYASTPALICLRQKHFTYSSILLRSFIEPSDTTFEIGNKVLENLQNHDLNYRQRNIASNEVETTRMPI